MPQTLKQRQKRGNKMKKALFSKAILTCLIFSCFEGQEGQADSSCDCIDVSTYQAPNSDNAPDSHTAPTSQTRYIISCYLAGEKRETLEAGQLANAKLIAERASAFKAIYKAPNCLWFPGGKRIAPAAK